MMTWSKITGISLLLLTCAACQEPSNRQDAAAAPDEPATQAPAVEDSAAVDPGTADADSTYTTATGKTFIVASRPFSASLAEVAVSTAGFDVDETHELGALDPIESVFLADLDQDGFQEFYITTRSAGSGSGSSIFGVASNKDRSTSRVHLPELERGPWLEGFMGHNRFALEGSDLVETFPVYAKGDPNVSPSGGSRKIRYSLVQGEAGWILKPVDSEDVAPLTTR